MVVDACYGSWAVEDVKKWTGVGKSLRHVWFAASHDTAAYDGCLTRTIVSTVRDGLPASRHPRHSWVPELTAGDLVPIVDEVCRGQSPFVTGYQFHDRAMYLAINRAANAEFDRLGLGNSAGALSSQLTQHYVPFSISKAVNASVANPIVVVLGDAGTGKSTLAAALRDPPRDAFDIPLDFRVDAVIFLSLGSEPGSFSTSIARQLATIPNYQRAVDQYRMQHAREWEVLDKLDRNVLGPLRLLKLSEPVRLVIDGLDELTDDSHRNTILGFITRLGQANRVIVTSRPGGQLPSEGVEIYLGDLDQDTARQYMRKRGVEQITAQDELLAIAKQNWLALDLACSIYVNNPRMQISRSREGLYHQLLENARKNLDWGKELTPVLEILAAVRPGPVLPIQLLEHAIAYYGAPSGRAKIYEVLANQDLHRMITRIRPGSLFERLGTFHATATDAFRAYPGLKYTTGRDALLAGAYDLLSETTSDGRNAWHELHASAGELQRILVLPRDNRRSPDRRKSTDPGQARDPPAHPALLASDHRA